MFDERMKNVRRTSSFFFFFVRPRCFVVTRRTARRTGGFSARACARCPSSNAVRRDAAHNAFGRANGRFSSHKNMSDTADRWLDRTIADAADAGVFGTGGRFASFASDGQHGANDQFASIVYYGTVTVTEDDLSRRRRILVKLKHRWVELRNLFRTDLQFHNEILFYEKIAPSLVRTVDGPRAPSLCRYFYGRNECGRLAERDLIVLENATWRHGYRSAVSDHPLYLDFDHLIVALRTLAK